MKKLILLLTLAISTNVMAADFIGGTVKNGSFKMGIVCALYDNDNQCEEFDIVTVERGTTYTNATLKQIDVKAIAKKAKKISSRKMGEKYYQAAIIGTIIGGVSLYVDQNIITYGILGAGIVVDIVKAPIVGIAFLTHKVTDTFSGKRLKSLIKHMINADKIGKSKRTRARYYYSLSQAFRNQSN